MLFREFDKMVTKAYSVFQDIPQTSYAAYKEPGLQVA